MKYPLVVVPISLKDPTECKDINMKKVITLLFTLSLLSCNQVKSENPIISKKHYKPMVRVGMIDQVYYQEPILSDYLVYTVSKSRIEEGLLYQGYLTITSPNKSSYIAIETHSVGNHDCHPTVIDEKPIYLENLQETYNKITYHITCQPMVIKIKDKDQNYLYVYE